MIGAAPAGERERWVSVVGHTTVEPDGAHDLVARLFARYRDDVDDPARADELERMLAADWVRIVLHPQAVRRFLNCTTPSVTAADTRRAWPSRVTRLRQTALH